MNAMIYQYRKSTREWRGATTTDARILSHIRATHAANTCQPSHLEELNRFRHYDESSHVYMYFSNGDICYVKFYDAQAVAERVSA